MPDPVADILAQFPGPVTLRPWRLKAVLSIAANICVIAAVVYLLQHQGLTDFERTMWSAVLVFCCAMALAAIAFFIPSGASLTLDRTGFVSVWLFRSRRVPWEDASGFARASGWLEVFGLLSPSFSIVNGVVFDHAARKGTLRGRITRWMMGSNDYLMDSYGLWDHNLARLMNEWRERALK